MDETNETPNGKVVPIRPNQARPPASPNAIATARRQIHELQDKLHRLPNLTPQEVILGGMIATTFEVVAAIFTLLQSS